LHDPIDAESQDICALLATEIVEAIVTFIRIRSHFRPSGFFLTTALIECIYHLMFVIQGLGCDEERRFAVKPLRIAYQLLVDFIRKRWIRQGEHSKRCIQRYSRVAC
jgi:hypothetical protein